MVAQVQTYFSYFLTKLVALALFLFILTSFNLQIITANAQASSTTAPTTKPDTTKTPSKTEQDSRIGSLKNCSVNATNETSLKSDPNAANNFIYKCLKDIVQIVITISVILAVMRLIFVGIKFLNTFGDEGALNAELSKTITGFIVGAVILGLFATIIQVVNPSALKIDKIFSAQVIADYKCLNKGISDKPGVAVSDGKNCTNNSQGSGPGGSTTVSGGTKNDAEIDAILKSDKPEDQAKKIELIKQLTVCDTYIAVTSAQQAIDCQKYQEYGKSYTPSGDVVEMKIIGGNGFANGKYIVESVDGNVATGKYIIGSGANQTTVQFAYKFEGTCDNSPLKKVGTINRNEQINFDGCIVQLS